MNSPTKEPLTVTRCFTPDGSQGGKFSHSCDEDMSESDQIEMLVHDLGVIVNQLTELAGPSYTRDKLQAAANDLAHESLEEQNEKLMQRVGKLGVQVLDLEKENQQLKDRLVEK